MKVEINLSTRLRSFMSSSQFSFATSGENSYPVVNGGGGGGGGGKGLHA